MSIEPLSSAASPFLRHIARCHNTHLPNGRLPLFYEGTIIGWFSPELVPTLKEPSCRAFLNVTEAEAQLLTGSALSPLSNILAHSGLFEPFHEWLDVRTVDERVIGQIDRGLIPLLGTEAEGVHLNALVQKTEGIFLWVAQRSHTKRLDPGKLDHLVAGGISTGLTPHETLIKEALEEAALPPFYTEKAQKINILRYMMHRPEGLRRDKIHCYDLYLPESFIPKAADGEVESFHLLPLSEVFEHVRNTDDFKFNVNLVLIDLFIRHQFFATQDASLLYSALHGSLPCSNSGKSP